MMDYCSVCCRDEPIENFRNLSCGCTFCKRTISRWVLTQLENYYQREFDIICPESHYLSEEDIHSCLSEKEQSVYERFILRRALLKDASFRFCPTNGCDFVGWVPKNLRCRDMLVCENCNTEWLEADLKPWSDSVLSLSLIHI